MRLLLDAHIPAAVIGALRKRHPGMDVQHLARWRRGDLLEAADDEILSACLTEKRVWVTFDLATVPDLLARFADEGRNHAGVFLADEKTVPPERIGPLAAAL